MKKLSVVLALLGAAACSSDDDGGDDLPDAGTTNNTKVEVNADITADTTWETGKSYELKKHIFVRSGTLTIQPGVKVLGNTGSSLVITSTAKINAAGTKDSPIVFTSAAAEGARMPGNWGGVVLLGKAPINVSGGTSTIEGFPSGTTGTEYGGTDAAHNCGTIKYARIEFGGFELAPNNELNGLTLGACGSATTIDYVQSHMGSDDALEIFGGTVNIKHIVLSSFQDDGLDWDFGWVGKAQFLIVQQSAFSNEGFEADNNNNMNDATPRSAPTIYNATLIGSDKEPTTANQKQMGMHLRRGTAGKLYNVIIEHFADFPIDVDGASTVAQTASALFLKNSILFDNGNQATWADPTDNDAGFNERMFFTSEATNQEVDPKLTAEMSPTAPSFKPQAGAPPLTAAKAAVPPSDGFCDAAATFIGAVGDTDWTTGWTAFPAN